MRKQSLFLMLVVYATFSSCSTEPHSNTNQTDSSINLSTVTEEEPAQNTVADAHETSLAKKLREARSKPYKIDALNIVRAETKYDADFVPTVYLEVENTTETSIQAFQIESQDISFTKSFKVSIAPQSTYSTSFRITDNKNLSGDIVLSVKRFIYSDGTMVDASNS